MKIIFLIGLIGAIYSYFIYPVILIAMAAKKTKHEIDSVDFNPKVSFIITAHNEEPRIENKIRNTLALTYPKELLEIIVASDCSTDRTDEIVTSFNADGVKLVRAEERKGKEHAQFLAIKEATGEIVIFSDVATEIQPDGLDALVKRFADPKVGAVSSEDRFVSDDGTIVGEGVYVKYEMWLRKLESKVHSLVGLSGSFFAARRDVCELWDVGIPSDFNTALNSVRKGYVAVSDPNVIGYYKNIKHGKGEYGRKFRTVVRGISAIASKPDVLNFSRYGLFAFEVWSHKIMRWLVPWFLLMLLVASFSLAGSHWFVNLALLLQAIFYSLALSGHFDEVMRDYVFVRIPYYFMEVNVAIAHATVAFLFGKRITTWQPSKR